MKVWYLKEASKPFAISFSDHLDKNLSMGAKILEPTFKLTPFLSKFERFPRLYSERNFLNRGLNRFFDLWLREF